MHALQFSRLFSLTFARAQERPVHRQLTPAPAPLMSGAVATGLRITTRLPDVSQREQTDSERAKVFMATLAHELRNTMAPLSHALEILGSEACDRELAARALPMAQRQLQHMNHLVDELLDMGRVMSGRIDLELSRTRLQDLVNNAIQACSATAAARRHTIHLDMPKKALWFRADPVRFGQVLANLLGNAIKFTPPGGNIRVTASAQGDTLRLCVSDDGVGIGMEEMTGIFELFRQEAASRKYAADGLGIGLSLVRRLVELHGGTVDVHSAGKGKGSAFTVLLPATN